MSIKHEYGLVQVWPHILEVGYYTPDYLEGFIYESDPKVEWLGDLHVYLREMTFALKPRVVGSYRIDISQLEIWYDYIEERAKRGVDLTLWSVGIDEDNQVIWCRPETETSMEKVRRALL